MRGPGGGDGHGRGKAVFCWVNCCCGCNCNGDIGPGSSKWVNAKHIFISGKNLLGVPGVPPPFVGDGSLIVGTERCCGGLALGKVGLGSGCDGFGCHGGLLGGGRLKMENWCPEDTGCVFVGELGVTSSTYGFAGVVSAAVDAGATVGAVWKESIEVAICVAGK